MIFSKREDNSQEDKILLNNLKYILDTNITNEYSKKNKEKAKNFLEKITNNFLKEKINEGNFTDNKKQKIEGMIGLMEILKIFNFEKKENKIKKDKISNFFSEFNKFFLINEKKLFFNNYLKSEDLSINSINIDIQNSSINSINNKNNKFKSGADLILNSNNLLQKKFTNLEIFDNLINSDNLLKKIYLSLESIQNLKKNKNSQLINFFSDENIDEYKHLIYKKNSQENFSEINSIFSNFIKSGNLAEIPLIAKKLKIKTLENLPNFSPSNYSKFSKDGKIKLPLFMNFANFEDKNVGNDNWLFVFAKNSINFKKKKFKGISSFIFGGDYFRENYCDSEIDFLWYELYCYFLFLVFRKYIFFRKYFNYSIDNNYESYIIENLFEKDCDEIFKILFNKEKIDEFYSSDNFYSYIFKISDNIIEKFKSENNFFSYIPIFFINNSDLLINNKEYKNLPLLKKFWINLRSKNNLNLFEKILLNIIINLIPIIVNKNSEDFSQKENTFITFEKKEQNNIQIIKNLITIKNIEDFIFYLITFLEEENTIFELINEFLIYNYNQKNEFEKNENEYLNTLSKYFENTLIDKILENFINEIYEKKKKK